MSDANRTIEEYIQRHANQYHNGETERAKQDAIAQAVIEEKQNE